MRTPHKLTPSRLLAQLHHVIKLLLALRARLRRRDGLIKKLRTQLASFTVRTTPTRIAHHTYPAEMIAIAVNTVVEANGSLRCAAKVAGYLNEMMGWDFKTPSLTVVSTWVKRLGRYALDHSAVKTGRYVAIIDESIQIGGEKYLLWLGVKLREDRSPFAPLTMADAEILGVEVQSCWTAREVEAFVCRRLRYHHQVELVYLISDQGTNLLKAGAALGQQMVADCSHVLMNALIKLLADNVALQTLTRFMGTFRRQHILSNRSALCPPSLRDKGGGSPHRFLRLFVILDWVERLDQLWPDLPVAHRQRLAYLNTKSYRAFLQQLREVIVMATALLKTSGLSERTQHLWTQRMQAYRGQHQRCQLTEKLAAIVDDYFAGHAQLMVRHGRLLCCSDIIESTLGRYKNKGGMRVISADVLAIALYGHKVSVGDVVTGQSTVSQKMVRQWHESYTCEHRISTLRTLQKEAKARTAAA